MFDTNEPNFDQINKIIEENSKWANLSVTIKEIAQENRGLVNDLSKYDENFAVPMLSGLLTVPLLQSHIIRIEILVALSVLYCQGSKKPSITQVIDWFNQIGKSKCVLGEDPAEDIFVSLVFGENEDYRLLEGIWENAGFYTQRVLDVIKTMPDHGNFGEIKSSCRALLKVSDLVCHKSKIERYQLGSDELHESLTIEMIPGRKSLISRVKISISELDKHNVRLKDITPFMLEPQLEKELSEQFIGNSNLENYPLKKDGNDITVLLPSSISIAVRNYAINEIISAGLEDTFDNVLASNYANIFYNIPLLGGSIKAPIHWKKFNSFKLSYFHYQIDKGYYISFHFFLPSVKIHPSGGMNEYYEDDEGLTNELQDSIDEVVDFFGDNENFKEGLIVIVGCGWGKGYATKPIELNHPKWRLENIASADLYRVSWHPDISPRYFWRIQDGLETLNKTGVKIFNVNGIMNMIGWARYNDGHLIPHSQLTHDRISVDHPLILHPPTNMLRDVRAEADQGYDRHLSLDNNGTWHTVQRNTAKPLFSRESTSRVYSSLEELQNGRLTSVYEGKYRLWISMLAPNLINKEVQYHLWKMVVEWLHRIGAALDLSIQNPEKYDDPLMVIIEFQDRGPFDEVKQKPTPEYLSSLCVFEPYDQRNVCKIIFKDGFIDGFRIAENLAERLLVRMLTQAYLNLLGERDIKKKSDSIEKLVVPNDNARSFHLFHGHNFIAYAKDFLPDKLIFIDPIDHAAAKIGIAFKSLENKETKNIKGKRECKDFLNRVVDSLINDIIESLKKFNQFSVLKRLVENVELANSNEDHWKRTSAAVLGLHGDNPDAESSYVDQLSKFAGTAICTRVLIEMALCVCPRDGEEIISDIEISKLIARVSLLVQYGGVSDAIYYNVLYPELSISSLGDILFDDHFGRSVVQPMLSRVVGDQFVAGAAYQKKNYDEPEIVLEIKNKISGEFWDIWQKEMGFSIDEARYIIDALENKGFEDQAAILSLNQSEFLKLVSFDKVPESSAKHFLKQFSLPRRAKWEEPPKGFKHKDIYPWRFGRRLSFVTRPILKLDTSKNPALLVPLGALKKSFLYVFDGAYTGKLDQDFFCSSEMRNTWLTNVKEGHTFNNKAADELTKAGWNVRKNIGLPEILNKKTNRNYGDVDIIAWDSSHKYVLVIECKDLSLARNYSEIAALLSDYQGEKSKGKPDKLRKHLDRVQLLKNNYKMLERFTGVQKPQIISCLICNGIVPMQYSKIDALSNTFVGEISDLLTKWDIR